MIAVFFNSLGISYDLKGNYSKAIYNHIEALKIYEEIADKNGIFKCLQNIGACYQVQGNYSKAKEYFLQALALCKIMNDPPKTVSTLNAIGIIYRDEGNDKVALESFNASLKISETIKNKKLQARCLTNIGVIYSDQGNYKKATEYFQKAIKIDEETNYIDGMAENHNNLGVVYSNDHHFKEAVICFEKSLFYATKIGSKERMKFAYLNLSVMYEALGNYKAALENQLLFTELKDSLYNESSSKQIIEMQTKYESEKKESENELLKQNNKVKELEISKNKTWIFALMMALLIIMLTGGFVYSRIRVKQKYSSMEQIQKEINFKQKLTTLELQALRSQMDPHFIFNCINSIQNCIETNNIHIAELYLPKFAKLLRLMLETSQKPLVTLSTEIKLLQLYLELEQFRLNNKFIFNLTIDSSVDFDNLEIPNMLLQPFLENAVKYGLAPKKDVGNLEMIFRMMNENVVSITITDNGIGRTKSMELNKNRQNHISTGINNIKERLELLYKNAYQKKLLTITDLYNVDQKPSGTKVEIRIPI